MKSRSLDTVEADQKWVAVVDAKRRSYAHQTSYTDSQQALAERTKLGLEMVYANTIFLNYRKKFIALKIDKPQIKDKVNLRKLEKQYEDTGIEKVITAQGIIYRIKKV